MSGLEARGRLPGEPVAIVDIGSNSVRLVAYESLSRALDPDLQREGAVRARPRRRHDRLPVRRRDGQGAGGAAALPRPVPNDGHRQHSRAGDRGGARRRQRPAVPRAGGAGDRLRDRSAHRPARGAALRPRRGFVDLGRRRGGRRPRRRLARACRRRRRQGRARRHPAARRPVAARAFRSLAEEGGQDRARCAAEGESARQSRRPDLLRRRRHLARAGAPAHEPAPISDAGDAQLRHPDPRRAGIRQAGRAHRDRGADLDRDACRPPAGRCSPMARRCSRRSSAARPRRRSSSRRSACAKACCSRACRPRSRRRIR